MEKRCEWSINHDMMKTYHDEEWGQPVHDDRKLFEFMILDGMQAGLSWLTVLKKREAFNKAFDYFDVVKVAAYDQQKIDELMTNEGIIRNKLKIEASIVNARHFIEIQQEFGSFDRYFWSFTDGKTIQNNWTSMSELPARTELSDKMSVDLKRRGFKFVGSTIIYAYLQAAGVVNDHLVHCFCHPQNR